MLFVTLLLMNIGIIMLYAAYTNTSPFIIIRSFIENKPLNEYE